jgi:hypothetical protein
MYSHSSGNLPSLVLEYLFSGIIHQINLHVVIKNWILYLWPLLHGERYFSFVAGFLPVCGSHHPTRYPISECHMSSFLFTLSRTIRK